LVRIQEVVVDSETGNSIAKVVNFWKGKDANVLALGGSFDDLRQAIIFDWGSRECTLDGESLSYAFDKSIYRFWKREDYQ
jgi:hypothetical protein